VGVIAIAWGMQLGVNDELFKGDIGLLKEFLI
jgi:hypothetical protein